MILTFVLDFTQKVHLQPRELGLLTTANSGLLLVQVIRNFGRTRYRPTSMISSFDSKQNLGLTNKIVHISGS